MSFAEPSVDSPFFALAAFGERHLFDALEALLAENQPGGFLDFVHAPPILKQVSGQRLSTWGRILIIHLRLQIAVPQNWFGLSLLRSEFPVARSKSPMFRWYPAESAHSANIRRRDSLLEEKWCA